MRIIGLILGVAVLYVAGTAGWQIGHAEIANASFQDELHDMASQAGAHMGL